jgi:hypothetical protein
MDERIKMRQMEANELIDIPPLGRVAFHPGAVGLAHQRLARGEKRGLTEYKVGTGPD